MQKRAIKWEDAELLLTDTFEPSLTHKYETSSFAFPFMHWKNINEKKHSKLTGTIWPWREIENSGKEIIEIEVLRVFFGDLIQIYRFWSI